MYREGKKVRKAHLANLSALSDEQIEAIRAVLSGVSVQPGDHRTDPIALGIAARADQWLEAEPLHGYTHGLNVAAQPRAHRLEGPHSLA
jgi:hypothetical protein